MVLGLSGAVQAADKPAEKCYGVNKAGKNDCQTSSSACAGTAKQDRQADAWIFVPTGTCGKIAGGSTSPKTSS
jgi:uncharacterized membrane protein